MEYDLISTVSEEDFVSRSVELLKRHITQQIGAFGHSIVGLSGGSTPRPIYEALGKEAIEWSRVSIFLVDDRYLPATDDDSNQKLIQDTLLQGAAIPPDQIIFPNTELPIDECIADYDIRIATLLARGVPHIVTLGLGEDGHIASLFPPVGDTAFGDRLVIHTETDQFAVHDRISTTMVVLASAEAKIFFLKGKGKRKVWEEMIEGDDDVERWPAQAVLKTIGGEVVAYW